MIGKTLDMNTHRFEPDGEMNASTPLQVSSSRRPLDGALARTVDPRRLPPWGRKRAWTGHRRDGFAARVRSCRLGRKQRKGRLRQRPIDVHLLSMPGG